jgi:hypothetical protein
MSARPLPFLVRMHPMTWRAIFVRLYKVRVYCHTPNEQSTLVAQAGADGVTSVGVAARDKLQALVRVDAGDMSVFCQLAREAAYLSRDEYQSGFPISYSKILSQKSTAVRLWSIVVWSGGSSSTRPATRVAPFKHEAANGRQEDESPRPPRTPSCSSLTCGDADGGVLNYQGWGVRGLVRNGLRVS